MSSWARKVVWTTVDLVPQAGGWAVTLDGRRIKTPAKAALCLPTRALARAVADEWAAQRVTIDPQTMPMTRMANSAIDKVTPQRAEVAAMLADYGGTDLLCYRARAPLALAARQAAVWDPLLDWAEETFGARLAVVAGVMPVAQDAGALARLRAAVDGLDPFRLAAFHDLVAISGSLILALAVARGRLEAERAWALSRIDEEWQIAEWGEDAEAAAMAALKNADFLGAARFFGLCAGG